MCALATLRFARVRNNNALQRQVADHLFCVGVTKVVEPWQEAGSPGRNGRCDSAWLYKKKKKEEDIMNLSWVVVVVYTLYTFFARVYLPVL